MSKTSLCRRAFGGAERVRETEDDVHIIIIIITRIIIIITIIMISVRRVTRYIYKA